MTKIKKIGLMLSTFVMASVFAFSATLPSLATGKAFATDGTGDASQTTTGQNVSDTERITDINDIDCFANKYYTTRTLNKDGDAANGSVEYSGIVPYGEGEISLGTYDLSTFDLSKPLFELLPQKKWVTTADEGDVWTDMFFTVYFRSGNYQVLVRFASDPGQTGDGYPRTAVFVGADVSSLKALNGNAADATKYVRTYLPYLYNGVKVGSVADENKVTINEPTPVGIYYNSSNTYFFMSQINASKIDAGTAVNSEDPSTEYRYAINYSLWNGFGKFDLKNVKVSIEFDNAPATQKDSWVMFTSIGGKTVKADYNPPSDELLQGGDVFEISGEANSTQTITLNKQVYLKDNDALTKLVEFETTPVNGDAAEIKEVVVKFHRHGASDTTGDLKLSFAESGEMKTVRFAVDQGNSGWKSYVRGNTTGKVEAGYGRECGYYFDGLVNHGNCHDENENGFTIGTTVTPRFALYLDKPTGMVYADIGWNDVGETSINGVSRYSVYNIVTGLTGTEYWETIMNHTFDVSIDVTLAEGVSKTYFKLTNLDGQSLARNNVTDDNYSEVYHSYQVEGVNTAENAYQAGVSATLPVLKDYGMFNLGTDLDYEVKVNGETVTGTTFIPSVGENKIAYFVDGKEVISETITAGATNIVCLGASLQYIPDDTKLNGIRYAVALKKDYVDALLADGKTLTFGMVTAITDNLIGEQLKDGSANSATRMFVIGAEDATKLLVEKIDDTTTEYYVMYIYVHNIPEKNYNTNITTIGFIGIDGVKAYSAEKCTSVKTVAQKCVDDTTVSQEIKEAVSTIYGVTANAETED